MKSENEVFNNIEGPPLAIQEPSPESSKYIVEIPVQIPEIIRDEINAKTPDDYNDSLETLVKKYAKNNVGPKK